jgi:hypothetical protein
LFLLIKPRKAGRGAASRSGFTCPKNKPVRIVVFLLFSKQITTFSPPKKLRALRDPDKKPAAGKRPGSRGAVVFYKYSIASSPPSGGWESQ